MGGERATTGLKSTRSESGASLNDLCVYPIKSCGGISVDEWEVDERGLRHDRRWMLVDETGCFISQRELPRMALIKVRIEPDGLVVDAPGMPSLEAPLKPPDGKPLLARVWDDLVESQIVDDDSWFSEFLEVSCKLVYLPDESVRPVDPAYAEPGDRVGLADGFPFLLISEASLADLNARLEQPLPMNRFRPNLVVGGCEPFAEDGWRGVRIGRLTFRVVKPCARCTITTVDQESATKGKEPLRTLVRFRRAGNKVLFGQDLIHDQTGTLRVGDPVEILQTR
ncbi:MAG: MOSC domain-containing protein [Actinomycetota bacterium]|nr:MOSC domain-containing protein [Actinomycetota bacterium]MDQ5817831.1 MOSC domain-containing protein [Actinomycetota bacterium]